jgi:hypothetical protein
LNAGQFSKEPKPVWQPLAHVTAIATVVGCVKAEVSTVCSELADLPNLNKSDRADAERATDFNAPIDNIWKK